MKAPNINMETPTSPNKSSENRQKDQVDNEGDNGNDVEYYEPEGRRMQLLRKALDTTTAKCVAIGRFSLFAKLHSSVARKNAKALQRIHAQYQKGVRDAIAAEVDTMCQEEQMTTLMNELDKIIAEGLTEGTESSWRPTGEPDKDVHSHLIPVKIKTKERLQRILESIEEENNRLIRAVLPARQNLIDMEKEIEKKSNKYTKVQEIDINRIDDFMNSLVEDSLPST